MSEYLNTIPMLVVLAVTLWVLVVSIPAELGTTLQDRRTLEAGIEKQVEEELDRRLREVHHECICPGMLTPHCHACIDEWGGETFVEWANCRLVRPAIARAIWNLSDTWDREAGIRVVASALPQQGPSYGIEPSYVVDQTKAWLDQCAAQHLQSAISYEKEQEIPNV